MKLLEMFDALVVNILPEGHVWSNEDRQLYNTLVAQLKNLDMQQLSGRAVITNVTIPEDV